MVISLYLSKYILVPKVLKCKLSFYFGHHPQLSYEDWKNSHMRIGRNSQITTYTGPKNKKITALAKAALGTSKISQFFVPSIMVDTDRDKFQLFDDEQMDLISEYLGELMEQTDQGDVELGEDGEDAVGELVANRDQSGEGSK